MSETYKKLEEALNLWGMVQKENEAHRYLVTESEWEAWVNYDAEISGKLETIIEHYDGKSLNSEDLDYLAALKQQVTNAHRMTEQELAERRRQQHETAERRETEIRTRALEADLLQERKGFLRNLFNRR